MDNIPIKADGLSKAYRVGARRERHSTLRDQIVHGFKSAFRRDWRKRDDDREVWALKDVSFEVRQGEVLGVIGRNGAGKSTLLKILSRITEPTLGSAVIHGRLGSLLEVGTGFHAELTGRENTYMSGAILGMTRVEIDRKFDEIVAFAEVEKFIDTPVKRYSSGMYMRLAFSVAAHLDTEILLVDEVLAVGDAVFQKKCLGKMNEVASRDRTVLFVSHNMGAIESLCTSAMWVDHGTIADRGDARRVVNAYLKSLETRGTSREGEWNRSGTGEARVVDVTLLDSDGRSRDTFSLGESIVVEFAVDFHRAFDSVRLALVVSRANTGLGVIDALSEDGGLVLEAVEKSTRTFVVELPDCLLYPGVYDIALWVGSRNIRLDFVESVLQFTLVQSAVARRTTPLDSESGVYYAPSIWTEKQPGQLHSPVRENSLIGAQVP
jgi:lipopolysaccharide transport system ATP-binding protein